MKFLYALPILLLFTCSGIEEPETPAIKLPRDVKSLKRLLETDIDDLTKLKIYNRLGLYLRTCDTEKALRYSDLQQNLADIS